MRLSRRLGGLVLAVVVGSSVVLSGCGGGSGGGGGGGGGGNSSLLLITAQGVGVPLWQNIAGNPTPPPVCPDGVFINSLITFGFDGAVNPSSLPQSGVAIGSINIIDTTSGQAAQGTFVVTDDPAFGAGNNRRVIFSPTPPGNPNAQCAAGLAQGVTYQVTVPKGGSSPQVVQVNGNPLSNDATTCFHTCGCPTPGVCTSSFTDPIPGAPFVVQTTPQTSNPSPPPVDPNLITNNTVQILVSEGLNPSGINLANVQVINSATGLQVPGTLLFHQAGSISGLGTQSRIDYLASGPLLGSVVYQIIISPNVQDFGGNPVQPAQGNPAQLLFFQTTPVTFCAQPAIVENFSTTTNRDVVTGAFRWAGDGVLQAEFPLELTGTGADGQFVPPVGTTVLDTNEMPGGGPSRQGIWNFTDVFIQPGAIVRVVGPYQAHFKCTGAFTLQGLININAGTTPPATPGVPVYEKGPEPGAANNGPVPTINCEAIGGEAGAGGGRGGTGSGITPPPGSPPNFQCPVRAQIGESGYGPTLNGALNSGASPNIFYAGAQGGDSGCFPIVGAVCTTGDVGGLGGAGGTAGRIGEAGIPRVNSVACGPTTPTPPQPQAQPAPISQAMMLPINVLAAGSGGGGGGDHIDGTTLPVPNGDDQGAGGGGGGGGLRISCVSAFSMSGAGTINSRGAQGATVLASLLGGAGGSGSGGEIWIQSFSTVNIGPSSTMDVEGPPRVAMMVGGNGCSNQASGGGGDGLVQIEAGQGPPASQAFNLLPVPGGVPPDGAVFSAPPFQFAGGVTGMATSDWYFTGYGAPDYTTANEATNLGNAPNAALSIRYEGAPEAVNSSPGNPVVDTDPTKIKTMASGGGPITAANLSELDGYAFIRFVVTMSYAAPPTTPSGAVLPSVDSIAINFNAAINCP